MKSKQGFKLNCLSSIGLQICVFCGICGSLCFLPFADLSPNARALLLAMSVLPASFGPDTVASVFGSDDWDEAADELVAASLWRLAHERYAVHPLVRQLALEELGAEREAAERRAGERIAATARAKRETLRDMVKRVGAPAEFGAVSERARTRAYLNWCESELLNLAAVADMAQARGDGAILTDLAQALSAFWSARGYWDVGTVSTGRLRLPPPPLAIR